MKTLLKPLTLLALLSPVGISALVAWQAARLPLKAAVLSPAPLPPCTLPLRFRVAFPQNEPPVLPFSGSQGYTFMSNGWLSGEACRKGTLVISGQGQAAGGAAPALQVTLDSKVIWAGEFTEPATVRVPVPAAGRLTLGYFNDFYRSEYRNASLENVQFRSDSCQNFGLDVSPAAGGSWNVQTRRLVWLFGAPVTLRPCGAGLLTFRASGREAARAFGTLTFRQGGQEIRQLPLTGRPQQVSLRLNAQPLEIRIANPYFRELGDRNLTIRNVDFIPTP